MNGTNSYANPSLKRNAIKDIFILSLMLVLSSINLSSAKVISVSNIQTGVQARQHPEKIAPAPDSQRLSKKIFPVIRKSFNRYPPYYLFIFLAGFVIFAAIRLIEPSYLKFLLASTVNLNLLL